MTVTDFGALVDARRLASDRGLNSIITMTGRPTRTPLYEMMSHPRPVSARPETPPPESRPEERPVLGWLAPGHTVRIPIGYVLLGGVAAVVLLVAAYVIGYHAAERSFQAEIDRSLLERSRRTAAAQTARDPLNLPASGMAPSAAIQPDPEAGRATVPASTAAGPAAGGWGPVVSPAGTDPRQTGLHYFIIAETHEQGAMRLAAFCRERGLEAYVVPANNAARRRVIVLPGFETRARTDPEVERLEERIFEVGAQWKAAERGASDLRDAYMATYGG